ncbi:hypothetical protein H310_03812 [Aphanomyces invadans]|uniref:DNA ligase n=1 Tax=Aphanomyces invadans TaxID=157072 RepID=A0A024UFE6_9STRA|nr:hypothetical protein H310_03812 [Aphanomyces invadans]ETW04617.1 hypothetical protein H310_03812 [Aphanomyces invadans]|eukprot:XP_008866055.1 hypothetical protein H310_03812 [Aphanomyces invadans]
MSKRQQSIMSFFGAKPVQKASDKKDLDPAPQTPVAKPDTVADTVERSDDVPPSQSKEETVVAKKTASPSKTKKASKKTHSPPASPEPKRKRLRRAIVEDDSDDEEDILSANGGAALTAKSVTENDTGRMVNGLDIHDSGDEMDALTEPKKPVAAPVDSKPSVKPSETPSVFEAKETTKASSSPSKEDAKAKSTDASTMSLDHVLYNPKEKNATRRGGWTPGTPIPYAALSKVFALIEDESSRLSIQDLLADFFRSVIELTPAELVPCIYLCVCTELAPAYENVQIGIGDAILIKSIGEATGTNSKFVKELYQKEGDLGKVAQKSRSKQSTLMTFQKPKPLSVSHVYNDMVKIARMSGNNSQASKCSIIKSLLVRCDKLSDEAKYLIRGLQGKLRIGLAGQSILMSLTQAFMHPKEQSDKALQADALKHVKRAFSEFPNYEVLASSLLKIFARENDQKGIFASQFVELAEFCHLTPGIPVSPMLARPTKSYAMVLDRFQAMPFTCEYKYDGERAQIHILPNGEISIFSRNFENSTERFPDVKLSIAKAAQKANVTSCIVDAEVVAVDKATNQRLPFQVLSTRPRKNVVVSEIKVAVCIYAFDLLYLNGKSFLKEPLQARRESLKGMFEVTPGSFEFATSLDVANTKEDDMESTVEIVRNFLEEAVKGNCEGLMVKTLSTEATYEPANRSHKWLKLKKDYLDGIGDSTDLVPVGAFFGRGKRTGVYGAYLLACYDPETEMYQCITKLGTGLSDEVLNLFYNQLRDCTIDRPRNDYAINDLIKPDVWFEPTQVWEILGADLSISPKYTAAIGLVSKDKGISLRFPRYIRLREDKTPAQATTAAQIADLYNAQGLNTSNDKDDDDDDAL